MNWGGKRAENVAAPKSKQTNKVCHKDPDRRSFNIVFFRFFGKLCRLSVFDRFIPVLCIPKFSIPRPSKLYKNLDFWYTNMNNHLAMYGYRLLTTSSPFNLRLPKLLLPMYIFIYICTYVLSRLFCSSCTNKSDLWVKFQAT
jgi:hypothetical protein